MLNRYWLLAGFAVLTLVLAACAPEGDIAGDAPADTETCGDETKLVSWVQSALPQSLRTGERVSVEGVVTLVSTQGLGGFFLEARATQRSNEPLYSNALFVQLGAGQSASSPGTLTRVRGRVVELGEGAATVTALEAERLWVCAEHDELPGMRVLDDAALANGLEPLEGMRVRLPGPLTVVGNDALLATGALHVSRAGVLRQPTDAHQPGDAAKAMAAHNAKALFWLDDGDRAEFPRRLTIVDGALPSALTPWRIGTTLDTVEGVVNHRDGAYRIELIKPLRVLEQAARPPLPQIDGALRVGSFNVLNLFNGDGQGGGFPTERGAVSADDYARQQAKLVAAVAALAPDVAALMEIENDGDDANGALAQFLAALNVAVPRGDYRAVATGKLGTDAIRVALIYRATRVVPRGEFAKLDTGVFASTHRVPLAQAFVARRGGVPFVVVANHFKSKGSCPIDAADVEAKANVDRGDGQGCWNALRAQAARELAVWLDGDPTAQRTDRVLIVGDLNAYAQEDPVRILREAGYVDTLAAHAAPDEALYSFAWDGQIGRLDHALASPALALRVRGAAEWHINAAESDLFDYRTANKRSKRRAAWFAPDAFRSSDHDPLIVGFDP